jgi:hypothetical protein
MKKYMLCFLIFFASILQVLACDVCKRNQPELLQEISHGTGPQAESDYYIIGLAVILVILTLIFSLKYLLKPGERNPNHIKNIILTQHPDL